MRLFVLYLLLAFTLVSCLKDPASVRIIGLDEEISISLKQKLTINGAEPVLEISSTIEYDCSNATFDSDLIIDDFNKHTLSISAISFPEECDNLSGTLVKEHDLNIIAEKTEILINIANTYSNIGIITAFEGSISLQMATDNGLSLRNTDMKIIPSGSLWGYLYSEEALDLESIHNELVETLSWDQLSPLKSGYYSHFTIDKNSNAIITKPLDTSHKYAFANQYFEENWGLLVEQINNLSSANPSLKVLLYTDKGNIIDF